MIRYLQEKKLIIYQNSVDKGDIILWKGVEMVRIDYGKSEELKLRLIIIC